jgi:small GTP-binding protein
MNSYLESPEKSLELLVKLLNNKQEGEYSKATDLLADLHKLTKDEIFPHLNQEAPAKSSIFIDDFRRELDRFEAFISNPDYEKKHIIGLGGGFSSGKSSFLNAVLGEKVLPTDIDPTTAVPTYLMHSAVEKISATNIFNVCTELDLNSFKAIGYDFKAQHKIELGHLLKSAFVSLPKLRYEHIAFLDTPGYSKPDSSSYSDRTDEIIARDQLRSVDAIIWVSDSKKGLTQSDIDFINSLERDVPILIIINKADKSGTRVEEVHGHMLQQIKTLGFDIQGVYPFSKKNTHPFEPIDEWIQKWNKPKDKVSFPKSFKRLFSAFKAHYQIEAAEAKKRMSHINTIDLFIESSDASDEVSRAIQDTSAEAKNDIRKYADLESKLGILCSKFFMILGQIGEQIGIDFSEPSEADMISDDAVSTNQMLEDYKKKHRIKSSSLNDFILHQSNALLGESVPSPLWYSSLQPDFEGALKPTDDSKLMQAKNALQKAIDQLNDTSVYSLSSILQNLDSELSKLR